jgi:hypothetical protein
MQLLQPSKTGVLSYMDGTAEPPARWARVTVSQGVTEPAFMVYYMVINIALPLEMNIMAYSMNRLDLYQWTQRHEYCPWNFPLIREGTIS